MSRLRIASIIPSRTAGGIGPVCFFAADDLARLTRWEITLVSLHDPPDSLVSESGLKLESLGFPENCSSRFLKWLKENPQDCIISSGVSNIEPSFLYLPQQTRHIVQIHDCLRRYFRVAIENAPNIDGVVCVAHHIENRLIGSLASAGFSGPIRTIHNGAQFPPLKARCVYEGPLRLLYLGRTDPFKGVSDLPQLLRELRKMKVPVTLSIVGPVDESLKREFARLGVADSVVWKGVVPHHECFSQAAESDLLLMPSRKEPFGMVTIEAMSVGCVPMAYDVVSGTIEIVQPGRNGILVPLGDIRGWARQISLINKDRGALRALSQNAAEDSRRRFSSERMASELAEFIASVMKSERPDLKRIAPESFPNVLSSSNRKLGGYQMLSAALRHSIRRVIGKNPRICNWILNRL